MAGASDSVGGLPALPGGHRWRVEESRSGYLFVNLEKRGTFLGFRIWENIGCEVVGNNWRTITDPNELKADILKVARRMLRVYTEHAAAKNVRKAVLQEFSPKEAL